MLLCPVFGGSTQRLVRASGLCRGSPRPPLHPAVSRFARSTGDAHSLSAADVRLIALARSLEVAYYGSAHLREGPPPPRVQPKRERQDKELPG